LNILKQSDSIIEFNEYSRDLITLHEFEILDHDLRDKSKPLTLTKVY
jgi:hypothetical protein